MHALPRVRHPAGVRALGTAAALLQCPQRALHRCVVFTLSAALCVAPTEIIPQLQELPLNVKLTVAAVVPKPSHVCDPLTLRPFFRTRLAPQLPV